MIAVLKDVINEMLGRTYVRYGIASVVALGSDLGLFLASLRAGLDPAAAAALGYVAGIFVHWVISSRLVFAEGMAPSGSARVRQKGLFVGSALVGLAITTAIVALANMFGFMPIVAKLIAIAVSFQATYLLRKAIVFA